MSDFWDAVPDLEPLLLNEADVETQLILPLVAALGWPSSELHPKLAVPTQQGRKKRGGRSSKMFPDLVLAPETPRPAPLAWVVFEAKGPRETLVSAEAQARSYSWSLKASTYVTTNGKWLEVWWLEWFQDPRRLLCVAVPELPQHRRELEDVLERSAVLAFHEHYTQHALDVEQARRRGDLDPQRTAYLDDLLRASEARCLRRWMALGLRREEAETFLADERIGRFEDGLTAQPVTLLIGEFGMGKSLHLERLLQASVRAAWRDVSEVLPLWVELTAGLSLSEAVRAALGSWSPPRPFSVLVFVDGLDELGLGGAARVLKEAREWSHRERGRVVLASRPLPEFEEAPEAKQLSPWSEEVAAAWISRLSGQSTQLWAEPPTLRAVLRRPLFATLYAVNRRERVSGRAQSMGALFDFLVERALAVNDHRTFDRQPLLRVARLALDSGVPWVHLDDVGGSSALDAFLHSGLVVQRGRRVAFGLPILTQWFGAECLAAGDVSVEELAQRPGQLEWWVYALAIRVSTGSYRTLSGVMNPLAANSPALAALVLKFGAQLDLFPEGNDLTLPSAQVCAERLRDCMAAWTSNLGPLVDDHRHVKV